MPPRRLSGLYNLPASFEGFVSCLPRVASLGTVWFLVVLLYWLFFCVSSSLLSPRYTPLFSSRNLFPFVSPRVSDVVQSVLTVTSLNSFFDPRGLTISFVTHLSSWWLCLVFATHTTFLSC